MQPQYDYQPQQPSNVERVRVAWQSRNDTDYIGEFWTAFGWSILTFGVYYYYIFYQLMRRMRDHILRRAEFLDAAAAVAWDEAQRQGRGEELRPYFERISYQTQMMRGITQEFRDPTIWLVIVILLGVAMYFAYYFLDQDLVKIEAAEAAAEADLAHIYQQLGQQVNAVEKTQKQPFNIVGRVIATVFTCGIYGIWWWYNMMMDPNQHFEEDWQFEDQVAAAVQNMTGAAGA